MTVQGLKPYSITAKDTGEVITGVTVHCSYKDKYIEGTGVEKFSISDKKLDGIQLQIGMEVEPLYNKFGQKVTGVRVL